MEQAVVQVIISITGENKGLCNAVETYLLMHLMRSAAVVGCCSTGAAMYCYSKLRLCFVPNNPFTRLCANARPKRCASVTQAIHAFCTDAYFHQQLNLLSLASLPIQTMHMQCQLPIPCTSYGKQHICFQLI